MKASQVRNDSEYQKFKTLFTKICDSYDAQQWVNEAKLLYNARLSVRIKDSKGQFSPQLLMDASAIDLSSRSRLAFIAAELKLKLSKMSSLLDAIYSYIYTNYCGNIRTIEEKKQFISLVLKRYYKVYDDDNSALEFIESFIKDIDQAGYGLKNMIECMKLLSETKGKVV